MKDLNYIFRLPKIAGRPERNGFLSAIITESQNEIGAFIGTPCIINKHEYKNNSKSISALFPFPFSAGQHPNSTYSLQKCQINTNSKSFIDDHKMKIISDFDLGKFEDLSEYVCKNGSITFRFSEPDCPYSGSVYAHRFITKVLPDFTNKFNNHTVRELHFHIKKVPDFKDVSYHLTFLDIRQCLPIFSAAKNARGLCLVLKVGSDILCNTIGKNIDYITLSMIFSNKLEGVFFVDGIQISNITKLNKTVMESIGMWVDETLEQKNEEPKSEKITIEYPDCITMGKYINSTSTISYTSSTSSTASIF